MDNKPLPCGVASHWVLVEHKIYLGHRHHHMVVEYLVQENKPLTCSLMKGVQVQHNWTWGCGLKISSELLVAGSFQLLYVLARCGSHTAMEYARSPCTRVMYQKTLKILQASSQVVLYKS